MKNSFIILGIVILIAVFSVLSIYSSTYQKEGRFWESIYMRQMLWFVLGLALFFLFSKINYRRIWDVTYPLYFSIIFLLLMVLVLGVIRLGAQRWLRFGWFNFQPSEIAKLVMVIFLARYYSRKYTDDFSFNTRKYGIVQGLILPFIYIAIPAGLIIEQPDLGSGLMVIFIFLPMLFLSGVKFRYVIFICLCALLLFPFLWHYLRAYQKERLMVFLNPNIDPLGAGYTIIQSKIAIGSGGFFGKGWLSGTQSQLHFLPESHTDFIFATFTEEWGFLGALILIAAYYLLVRQGIKIAFRTSDYFGKLLAFGISIMIALQVLVNIAMNLGLAPVVGVPLPLMSYGGSSILTVMIALGILVNIDKTRSVF